MMKEGQLSRLIDELSWLSVESSLLLGACALLIIGLFTSRVSLIKGFFFVILLVAIAMSVPFSDEGIVLEKSLFFNDLNVRFTSLLVVSAGLTGLFNRRSHAPVFYFMVLSLLIGSLFMIKANSLLVVYLGIELVSVSSYVLTALSFKEKGSESAIKFLFFGAASSAVFLVGLAFIYGTSGSMYLSDLDAQILTVPMAQVGLSFMVLGIFFKSSIFPMHSWVPGVYQSAPVDAVALFSVVPKLAGLLVLRYVVSQMGLMTDHWLMQALLLMGTVTVLVGTMGAIKQSNARRMIAFGSIAHSGFLMVFVTGLIDEGAFWYYSVVYMVMSFAVFYFIDFFERMGVVKNEEYATVRGYDGLMVSFLLVLCALVGLPPVAGFTAKFLLFTQAWSGYLSSSSLFMLAWLVVSVFATVVALFYYLRIPYFYFLKNEGSEKHMAATNIHWRVKIMATLFGVILLLLFFVPKLVL